jgi:hypothetical protein
MKEGFHTYVYMSPAVAAVIQAGKEIKKCRGNFKYLDRDMHGGGELEKDTEKEEEK